MLKRAILYKSQLNSILPVACDNITNMFYSDSYWKFETDISTNNWEKQEFVSVDGSENVIGYLKADIVRAGHYVSGIGAIRFLKENKYNHVFSKDLYLFLEKLLLTYNYRKLVINVSTSSPHANWYKKYINTYGGRKVGIFKDHFITERGTTTDLEFYEIFRKDFIIKYKKLHKKRYEEYVKIYSLNSGEKSLIV